MSVRKACKPSAYMDLSYLNIDTHGNLAVVDVKSYDAIAITCLCAVNTFLD